MDFIDNIKEIERWVTSTFTSAYIERSIDEESHSRRWIIHHADYMVTISYNYIYDYVNGVVSIKHKDPSTGQFMTEEYEGVTVNQFKEFVITYLEENKDEVFLYENKKDIVEESMEEIIKKIDEFIDDTFFGAIVKKESKKIIENTLYSWNISHPDYLIMIYINDFDYTYNVLTSVRAADKATGMFMVEEFTGIKSFDIMKSIVLDYLEKNKDKVKPYKGDDETLISHMNLGAKVHHIDGNVYNNDIKNVVPLDNKGKIKNDSFVENFVNSIIEDD